MDGRTAGTALFLLLGACVFDRAGLPATGGDSTRPDSPSLDLPMDLDGHADDGHLVDDGDGPLVDHGPSQPWWDPTWTRRRKLSFKAAGLKQDLVGFPVLVVLDTTRIDYAASEKNGKDLRFVDADHATQLPHEIESWKEGGTSHIWVRVPQIDKLSTTDHIWLYYGNPAAPDGQNAAQVWSAVYAGVWHLDGGFTDSTANKHDATNHGAKNAAGQVAGGQKLDGTQYFELPNTAGLKLSELSLELWFSSTQTWDAPYWPGSGMLISRATGGWCSGDWTIIGGRSDTDSGNAGRVIVGNGACSGTGWEPRLYSATGLNNGTFHHLTWTRTQAGENVLFIDGVKADAIQDNGAAVAADRPIQAGGDPYENGSFLVGTIDELRIAKAAHSEAWVQAQHASMVDLLVSHGPEEKVP